MKHLFHPAAELEYSDAVDFYENQQPGLGRKFSEEIQAAIRHRCLTNKFPYGVLYRIKHDHIRIIAVMHLRRKANYWQKR